MQNDIDLRNAIVDGNQQAFATLYKLYASKAYNTALSYTKNPEDAEEITQDVFIKIYKSMATFNGNSTLTTWIYRIVINTSLNYLKKNKRLSQYKNSITDIQTIEFEHPGVILENKENAKALYRAMDCLADTQKSAFILSYIEGLPRKEVAVIMDTSLKAIESLLQRAKKNMRIELENMYPNRRKFKK